MFMSRRWTTWVPVVLEERDAKTFFTRFHPLDTMLAGAAVMVMAKRAVMASVFTRCIVYSVCVVFKQGRWDGQGDFCRFWMKRTQSHEQT